MTLHTLSSGSQGNCLLLSDGDTHILVDAGISTRRIKVSSWSCPWTSWTAFSSPTSIRTIFPAWRPSQAPLHPPVRKPRHRPAAGVPASRGGAAAAAPGPGCQFEVGQCLVTAFETSHDAAQSMDYRIDGSGSVGILTDTGCVTDEAAQVLPGVGLLVLESNHDVEYLRSGRTPTP